MSKFGKLYERAMTATEELRASELLRRDRARFDDQSYVGMLDDLASIMGKGLDIVELDGVQYAKTVAGILTDAFWSEAMQTRSQKRRVEAQESAIREAERLMIDTGWAGEESFAGLVGSIERLAKLIEAGRVKK